MLIYILDYNLSTGSILKNLPIARVNVFTNPMSVAYNGFNGLVF